MGLREKIALTLVSVLWLQIPNTSCMPRSLRRDSLNNCFHKNNDVSALFPIGAVKTSDLSHTVNIRSDLNKQERSVYKILNYPHVEYPLQSIPRQPFCYSYLGSTDSNYPLVFPNTDKTNLTETCILQKLRREAKLKRKSHCHNKSNFIKVLSDDVYNPESMSAPIPYGFNNLGVFTEEEYPINMKDTSSLNSWKPISCTFENQIGNNNDCEYLKPQIVHKNIRSFLKPLSKDKHTSNKAKEYRKIKDVIIQNKSNKKIGLEKKCGHKNKSDRHSGDTNKTKTFEIIKPLECDFLKIEKLHSECEDPKLKLIIPAGQNEETSPTNIGNITCVSDKVTRINAESGYEQTSGMLTEFSIQPNNSTGVSGLLEEHVRLIRLRSNTPTKTATTTHFCAGSPTEDVTILLDITSDTPIFSIREEPVTQISLPINTTTETCSIAQFSLDDWDDVLQKPNSTNILNPNQNCSSYFRETAKDIPVNGIIIEPLSDNVTTLNGPTSNIIRLDSQLTERDIKPDEILSPVYILYGPYIFRVNTILSNTTIYNVVTLDDAFNNAGPTTGVLPVFHTKTDNTTCQITDNLKLETLAEISIIDSSLNLNLTQSTTNIIDNEIVLGDYVAVTSTTAAPTGDNYLFEEALIPVNHFNDRKQFCYDTIDFEPVTDVPIS